MALTRDQFVTEICNTVGKSETGTAVSGATWQSRVRTFLNWAQKRLARAHNFHELNTYTESAATVASTKRYPMATGSNNLGLVRPKDILSIRLVDSANSRKLDRWAYRKFDWKFPRPENYSEARPSVYVRHGNDIELFRIPNAVYTLHIRYAQWPIDFSTGAQTSDFTDKDELLLNTAVMETYLALEEYQDVAIWAARVTGLLRDAIMVEGDVDWEPEAEPHTGRGEIGSGQPWLDPWGVVEDPLYGYL